MSRGTDAINNYIGNEVLPTSVRVNIGLTIGPSLVANGDGTNFLRILIFQWYDSTLPATSGVLTTSSSPFSMLYWPNRENIKVLADRLVALHQYGLKQDSYDSWCEEIYIKGKNMIPIKFNAAGNGTQKGEIYILILSDSSVPASPYFLINHRLLILMLNKCLLFNIYLLPKAAGGSLSERQRVGDDPCTSYTI